VINNLLSVTAHDDVGTILWNSL